MFRFQLLLFNKTLLLNRFMICKKGKRCMLLVYVEWQNSYNLYEIRHPLILEIRGRCILQYMEQSFHFNKKCKNSFYCQKRNQKILCNFTILITKQYNIPIFSFIKVCIRLREINTLLTYSLVCWLKLHGERVFRGCSSIGIFCLLSS